MTSGSLTYRLPCARWTLEFSALALRTLRLHVQHRPRSRESVGQLYSRELTSDRIQVELATVLTPTWAAWARVKFDTTGAAAERAARYKSGLHCVGLWHTHPEPLPHPSSDDRALAREHAVSARGQLNGLVFAIVGTLAMPSGLRVWVDDGEELQLAEHVEDAHSSESGSEC
jgi:proteasome lid subunit RPN8/RPN11